MSLRDRLNLASVTISRTVTTIDGYGDPVTTTTTSIVGKAAIWSPTQGDRRISDKIARTSTHVLAIDSADYSFTDNDKTVAHGGVTYRLVGNPDDVGNRGMMTLHGMERIV